jgi:hypothetical protein
MRAVNIAVGLASPVPLVGHIHLNGANFVLRRAKVSLANSVNLKKKQVFVSILFHLYLFVFLKPFRLRKQRIFNVGIFLVISISFCCFESKGTLVFIESFGGLAAIQLAIVFCFCWLM